MHRAVYGITRSCCSTVSREVVKPRNPRLHACGSDPKLSSMRAANDVLPPEEQMQTGAQRLPFFPTRIPRILHGGPLLRVSPATVHPALARCWLGGWSLLEDMDEDAKQTFLEAYSAHPTLSPILLRHGAAALSKPPDITAGRIVFELLEEEVRLARPHGVHGGADFDSEHRWMSCVSLCVSQQASSDRRG